ncbi:MAG: formate dehydrogenase accessory sulfurtransferase FdhD [Methanosarcinales archaeon]|nr:formate dehydrogenase accessory sulfurtransferase FdhD [Methanosarcinales archaeon]
MYKKEYETIKISDSGALESKFIAAIEETIELYVNNKRIASILATPEQLKQLAVGYLVCEGIVRTRSEIEDVRIDNNRIFTRIAQNDHFDLWFEIRSSGCIGINWEHNEDVKVQSNTRFNPAIIKKSLHYMESDIYQLTRGTHAACIIDKLGNCVASAVDVGRHNAIDKAIGQALIDEFDPGQHFLLSTGRQPAGMILKAARAGIPMVVTKTAPLNSGIETARKTGICLVGFATRESLTVFANPQRLDGLTD